jgi:hypothetical protein
LEFVILELIDGDDVTAGFAKFALARDFLDAAVFNSPSLSHILFMKASPAVECFSVKQESPSIGFLLSR